MEMICHQLSHQDVSMFFTRKPMLRITSKPNLVSCRANSSRETHEVSTNLYKVLSLASEEVGFDEIKKAYRKMAQRYHPDVVPLSRKQESTQKFVEVQRAYEILSDPILRQKYDYEMRKGYLSGYGVKGRRNDQNWRTNFFKEVWENQLRNLEAAVHDRRSRIKMAYM